MNNTQTTCNGHRTHGSYLHNGASLCRVCHTPSAQHETFAQTLARKAGQA